MNLLIIGGTVFIGPHIVNEALERGHTVTIFNRGKSAPELFADKIETIVGDRDGGLDALAGRQWDAVIDTCGYYPRIVRASAEAIDAGLYAFVSTISVYDNFEVESLDESSPLHTVEDPMVEKITDAASYGGFKAMCEQACEEARPGRCLIARPGLIVGPRDPTDRFSYWPVRIARGGEVFAPGPPEAPVQCIDARDLAAWLVRNVEADTTGIYNLTGPVKPTTIGALLEACMKVNAGPDARLTWVDQDWWTTKEVAPFSELPLCVPEATWGFLRSSIQRAIDTGLTTRPLEETVQDTLDWFAAREDQTLKAGLDPAKEAELLATWHTP